MSKPSQIHLYDPSLHEMFYCDGRTERVPDPVIAHAGNEGQVEVVTCWAKLTKRIALHDEVAMIPAT